MPYQAQLKHVEGNESKKITLFALSTCMWCKKTKKLLGELDLGYDFVDVDLLDQADQEEAYAEMGKHASGTSFPTIVVDGGQAIVGFNEAEIRGLI